MKSKIWNDLLNDFNDTIYENTNKLNNYEIIYEKSNNERYEQISIKNNNLIICEPLEKEKISIEDTLKYLSENKIITLEELNCENLLRMFSQFKTFKFTNIKEKTNINENEIERE